MITKVKWHASLRLHLMLALTLLALSAIGVSCYVLIKSNQHAQDPAILYRIGELQGLTKQVATRAWILNETLNAKERSDTLQEMVQAERDITRMLREMRAGKITNALSTGIVQPITLDDDERSKLALFEHKWQRFLIHTHQQIDHQTTRLSPAEVRSIITHEGAISGELMQYIHRRFDREMRDMRDTVYGLLIMILLISLSLFVWLFFRIFKPLERLSLQIHQVERGKLDVEIASPYKDEIGQLTGVLQRALQRLHAMNCLVAAIEKTKTRVEMLSAIVEHLRPIAPVEWAGVIRLSSGGRTWIVEDGISCGIETGISNGMFYALESGQELAARALSSPLLCSAEACEKVLGNELALHLTQAGVESILLLPMGSIGSGSATPSVTLILLGMHGHEALRAVDSDLFHNFSAILQGAFLRTDQLQAMMLVAVSGLARLAESRDPETGDHLLRMGRYSAIVAEELNRDSAYRGVLSPWLASALVWLAPLHDIGKVGIQDAILLKPGRLSTEERTIMEKHAEIGGDVLHDCHRQVAPYDIDIFMTAADIANGHHEKFDGSGYPKGIKGDAIPLVARIVAVADVFDALTSKRPYKEGWPVDQALAWIKAQSGSHFDPVIVAAFECAQPRIMDVYNKYRHV